MTDNEIIHALECCSYATYNSDCEKCPYYPDKECVKKQCTDIIDLINRQQAENERLKTAYETLKQEYDSMFSANRNLMAEVERLTIRLRKSEHQLDDLCKMHNIIKSEAYKEFEKKSENILIGLYEEYHKIANKPKEETDMFFQGRAEAIWECINTNRNLVKELTEKNDKE